MSAAGNTSRFARAPCLTGWLRRRPRPSTRSRLCLMRRARRAEFHSRNGENPGLEEVLDVILRATWKAPHGQDYNAQIAGVVDNVALYDLMALVANDHASEEVRAISSQALDELYVWLNAHKGMIEPIADQAHISFALRQIEQFRKDPKKIDLTPPAEPPDGQPIGTDDDWEWPN